MFKLTPVKDDRLSDDAKIFSNEQEFTKELDENKVEDEISTILEEENYEDILPF